MPAARGRERKLGGVPENPGPWCDGAVAGLRIRSTLTSRVPPRGPPKSRRSGTFTWVSSRAMTPCRFARLAGSRRRKSPLPTVPGPWWASCWRSAACMPCSGRADRGGRRREVPGRNLPRGSLRRPRALMGNAFGVRPSPTPRRTRSRSAKEDLATYLRLKQIELEAKADREVGRQVPRVLHGDRRQLARPTCPSRCRPGRSRRPGSERVEHARGRNGWRPLVVRAAFAVATCPDRSGEEPQADGRVQGEHAPSMTEPSDPGVAPRKRRGHARSLVPPRHLPRRSRTVAPLPETLADRAAR